MTQWRWEGSYMLGLLLAANPNYKVQTTNSGFCLCGFFVRWCLWWSDFGNNTIVPHIIYAATRLCLKCQPAGSAVLFVTRCNCENEALRVLIHSRLVAHARLHLRDCHWRIRVLRVLQCAAGFALWSVGAYPWIVKSHVAACVHQGDARMILWMTVFRSKWEQVGWVSRMLFCYLLFVSSERDLGHQFEIWIWNLNACTWQCRACGSRSWLNDYCVYK